MMKNEDNCFSATVQCLADRLSAISALLIGLDPGSVELRPREINALGFVVGDVAKELYHWNEDHADTPAPTVSTTKGEQPS